MGITELTVEQVLAIESLTAASGETVSGRVYLDRAIAALGLEPGDYETALRKLKEIASGVGTRSGQPAKPSRQRMAATARRNPGLLTSRVRRPRGPSSPGAGRDSP